MKKNKKIKKMEEEINLFFHKDKLLKKITEKDYPLTYKVMQDYLDNLKNNNKIDSFYYVEKDYKDYIEELYENYNFDNINIYDNNKNISFQILKLI
jgi:hypothetical protein